MMPNSAAYQMQPGQHPAAAQAAFGVQPPMYAQQAMVAHQQQPMHPQAQPPPPQMYPGAQQAHMHMSNGPGGSPYPGNMQQQQQQQQQAQMVRMSQQSQTPSAPNGQHVVGPPRGPGAMASPFGQRHGQSPMTMGLQQQQVHTPHQQPQQPQHQMMGQSGGPHGSTMTHPFPPQGHHGGGIPGRVSTPLSHAGVQIQGTGSGSGQPSSTSSPHVVGQVPLRSASGQQHPGAQTPTHSRPHSAGIPGPNTPGQLSQQQQQQATPQQQQSMLRGGMQQLTASPAMHQGGAPLPNMGTIPLTNTMPPLPATAQPFAPGPFPQLQSQFPSGAGVLRLLQYSEGLGAGVDRAQVDYWRSFVDEFFIPSGVYRLVLWNPASREQKGFEVPTSVLPRFLHTMFVSGLRSAQLSLENPREFTTGYPPTTMFPPPPASTKFLNSFPTPNVTHLVEAGRSMFISAFENGWQVQMVGLLRASFVPYSKQVPQVEGLPPKYDLQLRLESLDYTVHAHTGYLPRVAIQKTKIELPIPSTIVEAILNNNKDEKDVQVKMEEQEEGKEEMSSFTVPIERTFLPDYPVNEYGISLRAMRCLEITESVCQLRDLIDLSAKDKLGPIDSLRKFASQYREMQDTPSLSTAK